MGADVSRFKSRINGWSGQCVVAHDFPHGGSGCRFLAGVTLHQKRTCQPSGPCEAVLRRVTGNRTEPGVIHLRRFPDLAYQCLHSHDNNAYHYYDYCGILPERTCHRKKVIGIFVGAAGALLLILSSQSAAAGSGKSSNIWGDLLCLLAQFSFSFYFVLFKGLIGKYSPITLMKWMFTYASICTIPFSYNHIAGIDFLNLPSELYMGIIYVVLGGTFLPYLFIPIGQNLLRPTVACMYNYVQPIVASLIAVLWGMDTFGVMKGIAVALVFTGVYIVTQSKSRAQLEAL